MKKLKFSIHSFLLNFSYLNLLLNDQKFLGKTSHGCVNISITTHKLLEILDWKLLSIRRIIVFLLDEIQFSLKSSISFLKFSVLFFFGQIDFSGFLNHFQPCLDFFLFNGNFII